MPTPLEFLFTSKEVRYCHLTLTSDNGDLVDLCEPHVGQNDVASVKKFCQLSFAADAKGSSKPGDSMLE